MHESARPRVAIIDYQMGNLFSVEHASSAVGLDAFITSDPRSIQDADAAILPGVGAFGAAMENLRKLDLDGGIKDFIATGRPFMGICLGLQLLFTESEEFGAHRGLDLVRGRVSRFPAAGSDGKRLRVPQIGWNRISAPPGRPHAWAGTPLADAGQGEYMYFVHSYCVVPDEAGDVLSRTSYEGYDYCSSVSKGNLFATQFHPEKSARKGIEIYRRWAGSIRASQGEPARAPTQAIHK